MKTKTTYRVCNICEATCGIEVEALDGEIVKVRGDKSDPFSEGHICPKATGLRALQYDPDRIRQPLLRTDSGFKAIEWDEAYDLVAENLLKIQNNYGKDAVAIYRGHTVIHDMYSTLGTGVLLGALNTRNFYGTGSLDIWPRSVQSMLMYGGFFRIPVPDIDRTSYFLLLGANPAVSNGSLMTAPNIRRRIKNLQKRGGKLVVIDPRRSETANSADEHHFIVPGSDAVFLLAMLHTLFAEKLIDLGRCRSFVNNLDKIETLVKDFTPEHAAKHCGIAPETICRLSREFAKAPGAIAYGRMGTCVQQFGTLSSWAIDLLCILTSNFDTPGGIMFTRPAAPMHFSRELEHGLPLNRWKSRVSGRDEVVGEFPAVNLAEEIETSGEGRIRALVTIAGNPVRAIPNSSRLDLALASLDFMVSLDFYQNETTRHANLILPPTTPLEHAHYDLGFYHWSVRNVAKWSPAVLNTNNDMPDAWQTSLELARRLKNIESLDEFEHSTVRQYAEKVLQASSWKEDVDIDELMLAVDDSIPGPDRILDVMLRLGPYGDGFGRKKEGLSLTSLKTHPHGLDLGALEPMCPEYLATATGQIDLAPGRIVKDLPRLEAWLKKEKTSELYLINRRDLRSLNSWLHNIPGLSKGPLRCTLHIHPDDAGERDLEDGHKVSITSRVGVIESIVHITPDIMPGVVSLPHGFGHKLNGVRLGVASQVEGENVNELTDDLIVDEPTGTSVLFGGPVEVQKHN